jgi:hypothetical protein
VLDKVFEAVDDKFSLVARHAGLKLHQQLGLVRLGRRRLLLRTESQWYTLPRRENGEESAWS